MKKIYLAGGCFWGMQSYFDMKKGVAETAVGYANGNTINPSYEQVCRNNTGYAETLYIAYDEEIVSLEEILAYFWKVIDPTSLNNQGGDIGTQYRTGIYYTDSSDLCIIEKSAAVESLKHDKPMVTEIIELKNFYMAEEYHQKYLVKNPGGYCHINLDA